MSSTRSVAVRLLERLGYRADIAGNGREALGAARATPYDVVLMDVQMPEMDGLEASRAICARWPAGARPRIIAMTAEAMQGDREKCLAAGMDDYIVKPVTLEQLAEALAKCRPVVGAPAPDTRAAPAPPVEGRRAATASPSILVCSTSFGRISEGSAALREVIETFLVKNALDSHLAPRRGDSSRCRRYPAGGAHDQRDERHAGARELSEQAAEIERGGRAGSIQDAATRVAAVEASYRKVEAALTAAVE